MKINIVTILVWLSLGLYAQQAIDSLKVVQLKPVTVTEVRSLLNSFNDFDTLTANSNSLVNSLQQQSNFYVNTASPNGLATLSLNGIAAKSIPIVWQNHNLNSMMNGVLDVQLLDNFLFNQIEIKYADSFEQAGWGGSAAVVKVKDQFDSKVKLQHQFGSFGKQKIGLGYGWHLKKIHNNTKAFYNQADNDYPILRPSVNTVRQTNNAIKNWGILNNTSFSIKQKHHFKINLWWQNTHREIATPLFTINNKSTQIDSTFRVNLTWQYQPFNLKASVAYFDELNAYYNPQINIVGIHQTKTIKSYLHHTQKIGDAFVISNQLSHNFYTANSTNFEITELRNSTLLKSVLMYQLKKLPLKLKADIVIDATDGELLPIRPGIYAIYQLNNQLKMTTQLSRHYSLPTFNDLYWAPGGNDQLKPESGYVANLDFTYSNNNQLFKGSFFKNTINNEIVWLPGTAFWAPENVRKLSSSGFSLQAQQLFQINGTHSLQTIFNYTFLDARNVADASQKYLQQIYRPKHKASINLNYALNNKLTINYSHQITSKRFTSTDNLNATPSYNTANVTVFYPIKIKKTTLSIKATLLNAYNTYYEVTDNRPMPGRHFLITTNLNFI